MRAVAVEHDGHLVAGAQLLRDFREALAHQLERLAVHGAGLVDHRDEIHRIATPFLLVDVGGEADADEITRLRYRERSARAASPVRQNNCRQASAAGSTMSCSLISPSAVKSLGCGMRWNSTSPRKKLMSCAPPWPTRMRR